MEGYFENLLGTLPVQVRYGTAPVCFNPICSIKMHILHDSGTVHVDPTVDSCVNSVFNLFLNLITFPLIK